MFGANLGWCHVVYRICRSRAMRSAVDGCVDNMFENHCPVDGLMMNKCAVEGLASMGMRFE
jgi:hypothetical protein